MVFWWLLGAVAASAFVGFGVWALLRSIRRRWVRIALSTVSGTLIFVIAGAAFVLLGFAPASDEFHSQGRTFTIYVTTPGAWEDVRRNQFGFNPDLSSGERYTDGGPVPTEKFFDNLSIGKWPGHVDPSLPSTVPKLFQRLRISLPASVGQRQDFSISTMIDRFGSVCPLGEQQLLLSSSASATARTSDRCETMKVPDGFSGACAIPSSCSLHVTWDLTPTESGSLMFTVSLPKSVPIVPADIGGSWEGYAIDTASPVWESLTEFKDGDGLTRERYGGFLLDLARQQIRIPIDVVTTLGMTRETYGWVALLGTCISAFLGTGVLWQLLAAMRSRREQKDKKQIIY